jgi:hypothetical protein
LGRFHIGLHSERPSIEKCFDAAQQESYIAPRLQGPDDEEVNELMDAVVLGETSVTGRRNTKESFDRAAQRTGLKTLQRLSAKYLKDYSDAEALQRALKRFTEALKRIGQAKAPDSV